MSVVVNISAIQQRFASLGWTNTNVSEVVAGLAQASIAAPELIAYLDALVASPGGTNDQTINGCSAADATKITNYLKKNNVVVV